MDDEHDDQLMDYFFQQNHLSDIEDLVNFPSDWAGRQGLGDPDGSGHFQQSTGFTCAVVAQQMILNDFGVIDPATGMCPSETQLTYVAAVNGWLNEGTSPADMGRLLEYYGVDCHHGQSTESMVEELAKGHKVIVAVDSVELWEKDNAFINDLKDALGGEAANHAIVVKGIKFDEDGEPIVVVNDPGLPDGAGMEYSLDTFVSAFADGGFHYVATDTASPILENDTVFGLNFNNDAGIYDGSENWYPSQKKDLGLGITSHENNFFNLEPLNKLSSIECIKLLKII